MTRKLITYLCAVFSTYIVATILVSQFNIARITELGFSISLAERLNTTLADLIGMSATYLPLIGIALLIAFTFTSLVLLRFVNQSAALFVLAGFAGILALHIIMGLVFGISGVAPTRSLPGLFSQAAAGAIGGYVYYRMVGQL